MTIEAPGHGSGVSTRESHAETFRRLYEAHYGAVLAYSRRRVGAADARDVAAEVFTIAWRKIDRVPEPDKELSWLFGIAYRVLGHQWRSRRRYRRLQQRIGSAAVRHHPGPEAIVVRRAQDREVLDAALRLRPADQEILRLAGWEELPHGEIAQILGISVDAVDQRFHRAKKRLAREYERLHTRKTRRGGDPT